MDAMSPLTRRFAALAIVFVVAVSAINLILLPFVYGLRQSLGRLGDVRFERAQAQAVIARRAPPPLRPPPPGMMILAASGDDATGQLSERLRQAAAAAGLAKISATPSSRSGAAAAMVDVEVEGPEAAIIAFIDGIETGQPLIRWRQWRVAKGNKGVVGLHARAVAAWRPR